MTLFKKRYEEDTRLLNILKFAADVCIIIVFAYALILFTCDRTTLSGNSMESAIASGDTVLINKMAYKLPNVAGSKVYVKRIIGLPGETVQIKEGHVYINGALLENDISNEDILTNGLAGNEIILKADEYFVLGDSRNNSEDSRFASIGLVKKEDIIGSAWLVSSPLEHVGIIK